MKIVLLLVDFVAVFAISLSLISDPCYAADNNTDLGSQCSIDDKSAADNEFQINRRNLLDVLAANAPLQNGFYTTETGKKPKKVYGLIQCRGDISADDCRNCTNNITRIASTACQKSKNVWIWFGWCFLRYSNASFFGSVEYSSAASTNDTDLDVPSMVSKGLDFMGELAQNASKQPLMFQTAVLDVGQSGKRYGMAQCTRDISKADCRNCLDHQLESFKSVLANKRGWEIHGSSCFMWYQDYQFYFNISTPASEGAGKPSSHKGAAIGLITSMLALVMVL
ncbi:hypothetical protein FNV43_RR07733 [Rhamnella rubrinervis]|uniref:Gnk2-homologous domain-containing protein n=1 Tax=Rhamnella rubrinervis TaxID=2594499 RepID=A0A8K0HGG2_9ROSA|nr:hypothetical protein FNV43_RR07733 [Rhamnella rubrinervis]